MTDAARNTTPRAQGKRRTYGAVSLLTATALLTTLASTPSYAHDENITSADNTGEIEYITWTGNNYGGVGDLGVRIQATHVREVEPQYASQCYASVKHSISFLNDSSSAQRTKMRAAITAAYEGRRLAGGSTPAWHKNSTTGAYDVVILSPDNYGSTSRCPDNLNPNNYPRVQSTRVVPEELVDFMASYGLAAATFLAATVVSSKAGSKAGSKTAAATIGLVVGCLTGALAQGVVGLWYGRDASTIAYKAGYACGVEGTSGAAGSALGAWHSERNRAAAQISHEARDTLNFYSRTIYATEMQSLMSQVEKGAETALAARRSR